MMGDPFVSFPCCMSTSSFREEELYNTETHPDLLNKCEKAISYLNLKCYGKKIDEHYLDSVIDLFSEWGEMELIPYEERGQIIDYVIKKHRDYKLGKQVFWTKETVTQAGKINDALDGIIDTSKWYAPWTWGKQISLKKNPTWPLQTSPHWVGQTIILGTGAIAIYWTIKLLVSSPGYIQKFFSSTTKAAVQKPHLDLFSNTNFQFDISERLSDKFSQFVINIQK